MCIKMQQRDVSRRRSNFLGITVQNWGGKPANRKNPGTCVQLAARHETATIKAMLMQVMDNFNIAKSDILACVIDIAANITRTVQLYIHICIYWFKKSEFAHLQIRVVESEF